MGHRLNGIRRRVIVAEILIANVLGVVFEIASMPFTILEEWCVRWSIAAANRLKEHLKTAGRAA